MKICYVFTGGRRERIDSNEDFPDDLFYGYTKLNCDKKIVQQNEFKEWFPNNIIVHNIIAKILLLLNLNYSFLRTIIINRNVFNDSNIIILTTNSQGVHFSFLHIMGLFRGKKICFIPMGLYSKARNVPFWGKLLYPLYFCRTVLITISKSEEQLLRRKLKFSQIIFIPFGVDADFWTAGNAPGDNDKRPYILSIGNDQNRDYDLLLKAWRPDFPVLKIITSLPIASKLPANVEVIRGNWASNLISDAEIREYYRKAAFIIITLQDTLQPSGQSVSLQAMSCKKAIILTRTHGLWETEYMKHMDVCYLINPNNKEDLVRAVIFFRENHQQAERIAAKARNLIDGRYNTKNFADRLQNIFNQVTSQI